MLRKMKYIGYNNQDEIVRGFLGNNSLGYHLDECHSMSLMQVPFAKIRNLAQFACYRRPRFFLILIEGTCPGGMHRHSAK